MLGDIGNRFIFPAPDASYGSQSYKRHLCWIPWNSVISPERCGADVDDAGRDGIPCLWFPAPKAATVILFFHANAEDLGMSFAVLKHMRDQFKVNVLAVEYPGYGLLRGLTPSESAIYEVALTAFRYLVDEIGVRYSQLILFGRSLGSGAAVYLAAQYPVGGLILVSAFSSIRAAVQSIVGRVFAWSFRERFPNHRIIANVSCSTLFIHGEADGLIPAEHSLRLFKRCRARKLLITPPRMEHNSNLFGDASFLAVPAIHFFGFPGYYTSTPPRLPAKLFESPDKSRQRPAKFECESSGVKLWLCDCLAKTEQHHLDVTLCRPEMNVEDITIRFFNAGDNASGDSASASASANANVSSGAGATAAGPDRADRDGDGCCQPRDSVEARKEPVETQEEGSNECAASGEQGRSASASPLRGGGRPGDKRVALDWQRPPAAAGAATPREVPAGQGGVAERGPIQPRPHDSPESEEEFLDDLEEPEDLDDVAAAAVHKSRAGSAAPPLAADVPATAPLPPGSPRPGARVGQLPQAGSPRLSATAESLALEVCQGVVQLGHDGTTQDESEPSPRDSIGLLASPRGGGGRVGSHDEAADSPPSTSARLAADIENAL